MPPRSKAAPRADKFRRHRASPPPTKFPTPPRPARPQRPHANLESAGLRYGVRPAHRHPPRPTCRRPAATTRRSVASPRHYRRAPNSPNVMLTPMVSPTLAGPQPADISGLTILESGTGWERVELSLPAWDRAPGVSRTGMPSFRSYRSQITDIRSHLFHHTRPDRSFTENAWNAPNPLSSVVLTLHRFRGE